MFRLLFVGMVWSSRTTCFCRLLLETWDGGCISVDDMHSLLVFPSFVFWRGQIWRPQLMSCNHPGFITPHAVRMSAAYHCCVQSLYLYKKKKEIRLVHLLLQTFLKRSSYRTPSVANVYISKYFRGGYVFLL